MMQKIAGYFTLGLGLVGLLLTILDGMGWINNLVPMFFPNVFSFTGFRLPMVFDIINIQIQLMLITGGYSMIRTGEDHFGLVGASLMILSQSILLGFVTMLTAEQFTRPNIMPTFASWILYAAAASKILFGAISLFLAYRLLKENNMESKEPEKLAAAGGGRRLLHWLLDTFFSLVLFAPIGMTLIFLVGWEPQSTATNFTFALLILFSRLCYYLWMEGIFHTTPLKNLTGSHIVNSNGSSPNGVQYLQRTLGRFIPFLPFSFFFGQLWHDQLSKTQVMIHIHTSNTKRWNLIWLFFTPVIFGAYYSISTIQADKRMEEASAFQKEKQTEIFTHQVKQIKRSDILLMEKWGADFEDKFYLLKVDNISEDSIIGPMVKIRNNYDVMGNTNEVHSYSLLDTIFSNRRDSAQVKAFSKSDLIARYKESYGNNQMGKFYLKSIGEDRLVITCTGSSSYSIDIKSRNIMKEYTLGFRFYNENFTLESIEFLGPNTLEIINTLPEQHSINDRMEGNFSLTAASVDKSLDYHFRLVARSEDGTKRRYELFLYQKGDMSAILIPED